MGYLTNIAACKRWRWWRTTIRKNIIILKNKMANVESLEDIIGRIQMLEVSVTSAANAVDTVLATGTIQPCIVESVIIRADAPQTMNLTSCPIKGCAGKIITFINAGNATQPNLDATSKQVSWTGSVYLNTGETLVMEHNGTWHTALNLTVIIVYRATADGGHLA